MKKILFTLIAIFGLAAMSYAKNIQEFVVTTNPPLSCQNCENKIKGNLRFEKGVKKIDTSIPEQRVTITYDADKTTPQNIEAAFKKINYTVTEICTGNDDNNSAKSENCSPSAGCCNSGAACCNKEK